MAVSQSEGGTRSGLLWEVERILDELNQQKERDYLPILLMENVPEVQGVNSGNLDHFLKWIEKLESLGYSNYFQILNAKNYGIPQNRKRCFMISIYGDYAYDFPLKIELKYQLRDFLEKKVDEKYYLSDEDIKRIASWKAQQKPLDNIDKNNEVSPTLTARGAGEEHSGMILVNQDIFDNGEIVDFDSSDDFRRVHNNQESPSIVCHPKLGVVEHDKNEGIAIIDNTEQGYKIANVGDGVNLASRMKHQRGNVQKGSIQTLKAQMEVGVVVDDEEE